MQQGSSATRVACVVLGGGINGAGIARDLAGRGVSVALVESGDLAGGTSSASTKLVHGGLRYLEFGELALVRKALMERAVVLAQAPHLAWAMGFLLPDVAGGRARWQVRAGLWLYGLLTPPGGAPFPRRVDIGRHPAGAALAPRFRRAWRFTDGWVDDARLVALLARDAAQRGARVIVGDAPALAAHGAGGWRLRLASGAAIEADYLVNATGPWAGEVARDLLGAGDAPRLRLVRGSHLVLDRIHRGPDAWMLPQPDGRIVFVLPWGPGRTLVGTTEARVDRPDDREPSAEERAYLVAAIDPFLRRPVAQAEIVHAFGGIRPLVLDEGRGDRETSRDWKIVRHGALPALSVVGGKLTTYRRLAEEVAAMVAPRSRPWTRGVPLPGGDFARRAGETPRAAYERWRDALVRAHHDHDPALVRRLADLWGTDAAAMLERGLGDDLGGLFAAEVDHMAAHEFARTPAAMIDRRTRVGLGLALEARHRLEARIEARLARCRRVSQPAPAE